MTRHQITRVRHELRRRTLTVAAVEQLTPKMRRIHFTSPDLGDFVSASFDDHVKMFIGDFAGDVRPPMRDFTPRRFDTAAGTMVIDYAVHDAGPAVEWAVAAKAGDTLQIGGPRGSAVIPDDFDWYLLIGDETALPAIGRRVEELRAGVPVVTLGIVDGPEETQTFTTRAAWEPRWAFRDAGADDAATLIAALRDVTLPPGEGFVWIAAEAGVARAVRTHLVDTMGHPKEWLKAAGYWQSGAADAHVRIDD